MKILCVLYDDPKGGMPKSYPIKDLPKLEKYLFTKALIDDPTQQQHKFAAEPSQN